MAQTAAGCCRLPGDLAQLVRRSYARRSGAERGFATAKDPATNDIALGWCRLMGLAPLMLFTARHRQDRRRPDNADPGVLGMRDGHVRRAASQAA